MLGIRIETFRRAALETLVIAVGVFAALAVDNWNEARKERQLETGFLDGIALDLELNIEEISGIAAQAASNKAALHRIIHSVKMEEPSWKSPEEFILDLVRCTYLGLPNLSSITFDELQSSGSMRMIRNGSFKRKLADYYRSFDYASQWHPEYRRKEAQVEEALLGLLPLSERLEVSQTDKLEMTDIDPMNVVEALRTRPEIVARLEDMVWVQDRVQTRYTWVNEASRELLRDITAMR